MFCVQCEQTIRTPAGNGCAYAQGMCGKTAETSDLQDVLIYTLQGLSAWALAAREQHHLREILAILRTRTARDFAGYKKPTVLRRVQRRIGLTRLPGIGEYARLLRQSPPEVANLADEPRTVDLDAAPTEVLFATGELPGLDGATVTLPRQSAAVLATR